MLTPFAAAALRNSVAKLVGSNQPSPVRPKPAAATPSIASQGNRARGLRLEQRDVGAHRLLQSHVLAKQRLPLRRRRDQIALLAKGDVCLGAEIALSRELSPA